MASVPREFKEAVAKAETGDVNGPTTMALLAEEAKLNAWAEEGVRLVGRAQRRMESVEAPPSVAAAGAAQKSAPRDRVLVGTGHRADAPSRAVPRFPNTRDCIAKAKAWLHEQVAAEKAQTGGAVSGIGGAASGADLLFHEVCAELGIPTTVVLAIPKDDFRRESVADVGSAWVERFNRLVAAKQVIELSDDASLPPWAASIPDYGVFQRGNIWMIEHALLRPNADVTLLALWNGKRGDGPGGTADMIELAQRQGAKVSVKNTDELFGLSRG